MSGQNFKFLYLAIVGILSYIVADTIHEVIGHGETCLFIGNKIELLTSVYFKSSPGSILVDIGGPVANLIFGLLTFYILTKTSFTKLFLFQVTAYNLFWFAGTILHSSFNKTGDWTFAVKEIVSEPFGKIILITTGILSYIVILRVLTHKKTLVRILKRYTSVMRHIKIEILFLCLAVTTVHTFGQTKKFNKNLSQLIDILKNANQSPLMIKNADSAQQAFKKIIRSNFLSVKAIADKYGFPGYDLVGKESSNNFWLLVQHSDFDVPFQKRILKLMKG